MPGLLDLLGYQPPDPTQMGLLGAAGNVGQAYAPQPASRLPLARPNAAYLLSQAAGGFGQGYGVGLQQQQQQLQNQLTGLTLQGYQRMQQAQGGGGVAATAPGAIATSMQTPLGGQQRASGANPPSMLGKPPTVSMADAPASQAPPLLNVPDMMTQYRIAAGTPGMGALATTLMETIQKGVPDGAYLGTDGGIYNRPGTTEALHQQSQAKNPIELRGPGSTYYDPYTKSGVQVANEVNSVNTQTGAKVQQFVPLGVQPFGQNASPSPPPGMGGVGPTTTPSSAPLVSALAAASMQPQSKAPPPSMEPMGAPSPGSGQPFMTGLPPAREAAEKELGTDFATIDKKGYDAANQTLGSVTSMMHAVDTMNTAGGWMSPGAGANVRGELAKWVNALTPAGEKPPFDPNAVGNWEAMNKNTKTMGLQMVNQYLGGSREAASVINGVTSAVPSAENTPLGFRLVASGIEQTAQRVRDLYNYKASLVAQNRGLVGAEADFNRANPPSLYTQRAIVNAIPDGAIAALQADSSKAPIFDQKYGKGMAAFIANGGRTQLGAAGLQ